MYEKWIQRIHPLKDFTFTISVYTEYSIKMYLLSMQWGLLRVFLFDIE